MEVKFSAHKLSFTICYYYWHFFWYYIITAGLTVPNYYIDLCLLYEYIHMQYKKHPTGLPQYRYTCIFNFTIQCVYSSQAQGGFSIILIIPRTYATARKRLCFLPHDYPKHFQYRIEKCLWIGLSNECLSQ